MIERRPFTTLLAHALVLMGGSGGGFSNRAGMDCSNTDPRTDCTKHSHVHGAWRQSVVQP